MTEEKKNTLIGISVRLKAELDKLNEIVFELNEQLNAHEMETNRAEYEQNLEDWSMLSTDADLIDSIITDMENIGSR